MNSPGQVERSEGVILRTRSLTETSLIIHWLTPEWGRLATVAKGARRPKSPFRGKLDLFYEAEFSFARSLRSELHTLREVMLKQTHSILRQDLPRLRVASYAAALLEQTTESETPLPELFQLFQSLLFHLHSAPGAPKVVFAFELKLLHELGLAPNASSAQLDAGTQQVLARLAHDDWEALPPLQLSQPQTRQLRQFLQRFLEFHLGRVPASRNAALGVHAST